METILSYCSWFLAGFRAAAADAVVKQSHKKIITELSSWKQRGASSFWLAASGALSWVTALPQELLLSVKDTILTEFYKFHLMVLYFSSSNDVLYLGAAYHEEMQA